MSDIYDILIIGGGINGTAVARDAAGRGLSVCLCERDDLAQHTSSASTKLIHGGLRYLEYYEFNLVRKALIEREVLLKSAPHIIWPLRFVLPYDKGLRPKWMLRAGLFLYDSLGGREILPGTKTLDLRKAPHGDILEAEFTTGFEYSDCWVEDARLVVLNAVDASEHGADIRVRTEVKTISPEGDHYVVTVKNAKGKTETLKAKAIINSTGPWVDNVLTKAKPGRNDAAVRLVKGSHIVTKKLFEGDHCYIFQNADNRIIFAIPYEREFTLIGTTDIPYEWSDGPVKASDEEIKYLCDAANEYFQHDFTPDDVIWTYSGVRPLYDDKSEDASAVTRDYVLDMDYLGNNLPILSIFGGKITTSRKLAEHVMEKLEDTFPKMGKKWTKKSPLPGGEILNADFDAFLKAKRKAYPEVPENILYHLCRAYGAKIDVMLENGIGEQFGGSLTEAEARYLVTYEWAKSADDILWRRTKCGLHMSEEERNTFIDWFEKFN